MNNRWKSGATAAHLAFALALGLVGCSSEGPTVPEGSESERTTGSLGLGLTLPDGTQVASVHYSITLSGSEVSSGDIPVAADGRVSTSINGLAAGAGYRVVLWSNAASDAGLADVCNGSATFAVIASQTTSVNVLLECGAGDDPSGAVTINGKFDVCPRIGTTTVTPATVQLGASALISASASDKEGDALTFAWTSLDGSPAPANATNTNFTCTTAGTKTLTLVVTDAPGCAKSIDVTVHCLPGTTSLDGGVLTTPDAAVARVQILGFNDFHGNIEPPTGSNGTVVTGRSDAGVNITTPAGGAAYFARHLLDLRAQNPYTLTVSAGDLIGASPLASALFHDEPTIEAFNLMGLDINGVGNHEFDEGAVELRRMQYGGCHPLDGCVGKTTFTGANFKFLAANVYTDVASSSTLFDRYAIRELNGVKIAFIGMTLEGTPEIVTPAGVAGLTFKDEADTVNAIIPELQAQGVHSVVVVIHEGGFQTGFINDCVGISGAIIDIVNRLDPEVDLVLSGHTHAAYNCTINNKRVTSALAFGRLITQVTLDIDRTTQNVVHLDAVNTIVSQDVAKVPAVDDLVNKYLGQVAPLRAKVVGHATAVLPRAVTQPDITNAITGESPLGDVIADAQLAASLDPSRPLPHVAFMNPGGVRADLQSGAISYDEAFTIQPFSNTLVAITMTGANLKAVLEQQFQPAVTRVLQQSYNLKYTMDVSQPVGSRISNITIDGAALDPAVSYRVTVNNFLVTGGDGFTVFTTGTDQLGGAVDVDAFTGYLTAHDPIAPPVQDRITRAH